MTEQLSFKEFTELALRTESKIDGVTFNYTGFIALLDLFITVGTFLDYTKKGMFYNNYTMYDEKYKELMHRLHSGMLTLQNAESEGERTFSADYNVRVIHGLLGIVTESSEIAEILCKYMLDGSLDITNCVEEGAVGGGDIGWYQAILSDEFKIDQSVGMRNVIEKLKVRFPEKYSDENAATRNIQEERIKLESR